MSSSRHEHIVVGVDGSLAARGAVRWAVEHAATGDTIDLVHAWEPSPSTSEVGMTDPDDERPAQRLVMHEIAHVDALARERGVVVIGHAVRQNPSDLLRRCDADLVVVGSDGRGSWSRSMLASVGSRLARHAKVPVVVVPFRPLLGKRRPQHQAPHVGARSGSL